MTSRHLGALAAAWMALAGCDMGERETETRSSTTRNVATGAVPTTTQFLPQVDEPPPSAKQLLGTWSRTGSSTLFRFNRDGTFDVDTHRLDDPLYATGPYELDGSTLTFTASGPSCADDWQWQIGIVRAESRSDDELHIVFHEEGCGIPAGAEWTLARLQE